MAATVRHWLGAKKYAIGQTLRKLAYRTPTPWSKQVVARFWEEQAEIIHQQWGYDQHDFAILSRIFTNYGVSAVIDVGCGSGRLFDLYAQQGIRDVVGVDISEKALQLANERHPWVPTQQSKVEDLAFPNARFDLAICNRVLQHIPPAAIGNALAKLCTIAQRVYVNELTHSDELDEEFFMFRHDYEALFAVAGLYRLESGQIGRQTYYLYGK